MGHYEEATLEHLKPEDRLLAMIQQQVALQLDIRDELRLIKVVLLKQHIEMTHVCDSTRGVPPNNNWVDTTTLQISDEDVNKTILGIEMEQVALEAMAKNGEMIPDA